MNQSKKIEWTKRGSGTYTPESSDNELMDELMEIGKPVAKKDLAVVQQDKEVKPSYLQARPLPRASHPSLNFLKTYGWLPTDNEEDVRKFFSEDQGFKIAKIYFHNVNGYSHGACFIEFQCEENVELAMSKHKQHYNERYIMVSRVDKIYYDRLMRHVKANTPYAEMSFIQIYGFNGNVTEKDMIEFLGEISIEKFFLSSEKCEAFIKLSCKADEETVLVKGHFARLCKSFVKIQRITGVTFYKCTKGMKREIQKLSEIKEIEEMKEKEKFQTYEEPKNDVNDWRKMVEHAHKKLKLIQEMVPEEDYIIQTLLKNLDNDLNMFDQKFQNDADARQNMLKEIQDLKDQKKKEKYNKA